MNTRRHMLNDKLKRKLTGESIIKNILYRVHDTSIHGLPLMIWSNQYNKLVNALIEHLDNYDVSYLLLDGKSINFNSFESIFDAAEDLIFTKNYKDFWKKVYTNG